MALEDVDRADEEQLGDQPGQTDAESGDDISQRAGDDELQVELRRLRSSVLLRARSDGGSDRRSGRSRRKSRR
jgi:hypothetical protein